MIHFHVSVFCNTITLMLIIPVICGDCQVMGLPSQIFCRNLFLLVRTSVFFSHEILNEPSLTPFHVPNQFGAFCDAFKFTAIAYLRAPLTAVICVSSNYSGVYTWMKYLQIPHLILSLLRHCVEIYYYFRWERGL